MKSLAAALLILSSITAHAACESGQLTTLTASVDFERAEPGGKKLKISLPAGTEVHIVAMTPEVVGLYATTLIQDQQLSFTSTGFASDVLKVLRCSAARN